MAKKNLRREEPVRLSKEQLRDSRAGRLGRFPSEDLYEPEPNDMDQRKRNQLIANRPSSSEHEQPRKRSAAVSLE